jgi:hypothetical protein
MYNIFNVLILLHTHHHLTLKPITQNVSALSLLSLTPTLSQGKRDEEIVNYPCSPIISLVLEGLVEVVAR